MGVSGRYFYGGLSNWLMDEKVYNSFTILQFDVFYDMWEHITVSTVDRALLRNRRGVKGLL